MKTGLLPNAGFVFLFLAMTAAPAFCLDWSAMDRFEKPVVVFLHEDMGSDGMNMIMSGLTFFGDPRLWFSMSLAITAREDTREMGRELLDGCLLTGSFVWVSKIWFDRNRPYDPGGLEEKSFPSGHTAFAFSIAGILGRWYPDSRNAFTCMARLVALSRVQLGRHYPFDVLAGAVLGIKTANYITGRRHGSRVSFAPPGIFIVSGRHGNLGFRLACGIIGP